MSKRFFIFDSDALKNFHKRIFFSIIIFISFYLIVIFRIANVMVFEINTKQAILIEEEAVRGKIYDRNGKLLATNINNFSLSVREPFKIKNKLVLSNKLSKILSLNKDEILYNLNSNKNFVYIKRNISPKEHQKIIELGEIHLQTEKNIKRVYPFHNIGSHTIGYVNIDNKGQSGAERGFDDELSKGKNIYLTIDVNLQNAVRQELVRIINKFSAVSGISIIMNLKNGEILSLISYPDFDPNKKRTFNQKNLLNRALQANYEMGSTFKPLTVAMGIDKDLITPNMSFDVSKPIKGTIHDYHPHDGNYNIKEIVVNSSNIGIAKIAKIIGKNNQIEFFKKIGFYDKINFHLKEAAKPLGNKNNWGLIETMTIGYGHGFAITPLHLISAYASISNEGIKVIPKILLHQNDTDYSEQIIKKQTSDYILKLLRAVVLETKFTGKQVKIEGYQIGGKTGTADLNKNGKYLENENLTSFIAVFPISKPQYVVLSIIENPNKTKEIKNLTGATVSAPLVKNIILRMIEILNIPRIPNDEILNADIRVDYQRKYATY